MAYLDHEKLDVYQHALDFLPLANRIAGAVPRGYSWLADQLRRAATSVSLNTRPTPRKRGQGPRCRGIGGVRGEGEGG